MSAIISWYRLVLTASCCLVAAAVSPAQERNVGNGSAEAAKTLPDDWTRTVEVPAVKDGSGGVLLTGATLKLSVQKGWLVVRRETPAGDPEWQVVLARADDPHPPEVDVDKAKGSFELSYGASFVRETFGGLRLLRERKSVNSPAWPRLPLDPKRTPKGSTGTQVKLSAWESGDWSWVASGLPDDRSDVWVRLNHKELVGNGFGFSSRGRLVSMFDGRARIQDEGDLLVAERVLSDAAEQALRARKLRKEMGNKPAPALAVRDWLNPPAELALDKLRGKVVLLDFWGKWCGPCVKKLPQAEALHKKYKDRGLVIIGVHSANDSEGVGEFLKGKGVTFPVAIDKGETAKRYVVEAWPTYFLIDKAGKVRWGFSSEPPTESQIEELLRAEPPR